MAGAIRQLIDDGVPPAEIAVLYRVNAQSEVYEQALTEAGIQVRGGLRVAPTPSGAIPSCSTPGPGYIAQLLCVSYGPAQLAQLLAH